MCGIWATFGIKMGDYNRVAKNFTKISHRGPDAFRLETVKRLKGTYLGFHRLAIMDNVLGMQPMQLWQYPDIFLLCDGRIYNYEKLAKQYKFDYRTQSDVEIIIHLYKKGGLKNVAKQLDGEFAFCLIDSKAKKMLVGRDPYGVRPLFRLLSYSGQLALCSESKGLVDVTRNMVSWKIMQFPPGTFEEYDLLPDGRVTLRGAVQYHKPGDKPTFEPFVPWDQLTSSVEENIRKLLSAAVEKRLMGERRIGCLLSGGLDSSLIAAFLVKFAKEKEFDYTIQTFAVGMEGSPDLEAAKQVASFLGTDHHEVHINDLDVLNIVKDVIYTLESDDVETVRASLGMYYLARYIKEKTQSTIIFTGDGADEVAQGYIYFRYAPDTAKAHKESLKLLRDIHFFDILRADRILSAHSLELRVPFLDLQFTNYYLSLDPASRQPQNKVEKHLLRSAFGAFLPENILWRKKEVFSDGITGPEKSIHSIVYEAMEYRLASKQHMKFYHRLINEGKVPSLIEALHYWSVFKLHYRLFRNGCNFDPKPYFWRPAWNRRIKGPSARNLSHNAAGKKVDES